MLSEAVHEEFEFENAVSYEHGYRAGWADAEASIAREIREACGVDLPDARAVVRWLIAGVGQVKE